MDANVYLGGQNVSFAVPKDHWDDVLRALTPSRATDGSHPWIVLGTLHIQTTDGKSLVIELYQPHGECAFKIEGTYYRGGSTDSLIEALTTAMRAAHSPLSAG